MRVVIDIPEKTYRKLIENGDFDGLEIIGAIENGTPLPKGHGRLKDEYYILSNLNEKYLEFSSRRDLNLIADIVQNAPTIIETDKEVIYAGGN